MYATSDYSEEQLIALTEQKQREDYFNRLGIISATIMTVILVLAKIQS